MSGFVARPIISSTFNSTNYQSSSSSLTIGDAQRLFCEINDPRLAYTRDITPGIATANKALLADSSRNITNINSLSATNLTGILTTAGQPNITSIGAVTSLTIGSEVLGATQAAYLTGITTGTAANNKALVVDSTRNIRNIRSVIATYASSASVDNTVKILTDGANTDAMAYPLTVGRTLIGSNTPPINAFHVAIKFDAPTTSSPTDRSFARIYATVQGVAASAHQGMLTFSTVFNGAFRDAMTLSSTADNTHNLVMVGTDSSISSGKLILSNTSYSGTLAASNALQVAGGVSLGGVLNSSYYNCLTAFSGSDHTASTQSICLNDHAIYFRGRDKADTNHGLMYSGSSNAAWNAGKGFANPTTAVDGPVLFGRAGVVIGNMNSASTPTICATFVGKTTTLAERLSVGTTLSTYPLNINTITDGGCRIYNGASYVDFNVNSSGRLQIGCRNNALNTQFPVTILSSNSIAKLSLQDDNPYLALDIRGRRWGLDPGYLAGNDSLSLSSGSGFEFIYTPTAGLLGSVVATIDNLGRVYATQYNTTSDLRVKTNVKSLDLYDCMQFMNIDAKQYNLRDEAQATVGFIAQNVLELESSICKSIVAKTPSKDPAILASGDNMIYSIAYDRVIVIHQRVIQFLLEQNNLLLARVTALEKHLKIKNKDK